MGRSEGPCTRDPPLVSAPYQEGNNFSHSNVERFEDKVCLHDAYSMFEERAWTAHDQVALTTYRSFPMASHSPDRYHRI